MPSKTLAAVVALSFALVTPALAKDDKALKLIPGGTAAVVHLDFAAFRASPLFKRLEPMLANPQFTKGMDEVKKNFGIDPMKEVDGLTVFVDGKPGRAVVVFKGKFNKAKVVKQLSSNKEVKAGKHKGVATYTREDDALAFIGSRIVLGKSKMVKSVIAASKGKKAKTKVRALLGKVDTGKTVWFAFSPSKKMMKQTTGPVAGQVVHVLGTADATKGLVIASAATMTSAKAATKVASLVQKQVEAMGANKMAAAMGGDVLKKLQVAAKGKEVTGTLPLTEADLTKLQALMAMAAMARGGAGMPNKPPMPPTAPVAPVKK